MSVALTVNGVVFDYPEVDDVDWGPEATDWAVAVTSGMLQKAGGLFQLLAEVDFGTSFGIKSIYFESRSANNALTGIVRLANEDEINWRNAANDADLTLKVNSSNVLEFDGSGISAGGQPVQTEITVSDTSTIDLTFAANNLSAAIVAGSITNSMISASAAIAFSKLASLTSGNILVGSAGNVATSVAMSGDATIIASGALTIANSAVTNAKLANMAESTIKGRAASSGTGAPVDLSATQATAILNNFVGDSGSGGTKGLVPAPAAGDAAADKFLKADGTWTAPSGSGDVVGPASSTNNGFARFDGTDGKLLKDSPADISNADIATSAAIAYSKLAALTASRALVSDGSGIVSVATTTATEIGYVNGVTSAIQTQLNAKAPLPTAPLVTVYNSGSGTHTFTGSPLFITVEMVGGGGGGGAGGTSGGSAGTAGTSSTFASTLVVAGGGSAGTNDGDGAAGGNSSFGAGATGIIVQGGRGGGTMRQGTSPLSQLVGGQGGSSAFSGAGSGGIPGGSGNGQPAYANSGSGGGGGYASATTNANTGAGGGAGGYAKAWISGATLSGLSGSAAYSVGTGGNGQAAGTGGGAGGGGASGKIVITEYYQ